VAIGPVEYMIVGFPGNQFNGEIAPALADLVQSKTIRVLDLVFITKDAEGNVGAVEFDEHDGLSAFAEIDGEVGGIISHEDVEYAAHDLEPNSSAALLIWETRGRRRSWTRCAGAVGSSSKAHVFPTT
jgi:Family of unknown function (DUF6325)